MEILNRLREATADIHRRIEKLPFSRRMLTGQISRREYTVLLQALLHIHQSYERILNACPALRTLWPQCPSRAAALARDLECLGVELNDRPGWVEEWISQIDALQEPMAWAGAGYVLEGSRQGSRFLAAPLAKALDLPLQMGVGLDYHLDNGPDPAQTWRAVGLALSNLATRLQNPNSIVAAAVITFENLHSLYRDISTLPQEIAQERSISV